MGTLVLYAFLAFVAVGCLYGLAMLFLSRTEQISPPVPDRAPWALSEQELSAQDVVDIRLPVALRGYRFAETDLLLDRLTEELRLRDEEIARLQSQAQIAVPTYSASESSSFAGGLGSGNGSYPAVDPYAPTTYSPPTADPLPYALPVNNLPVADPLASYSPPAADPLAPYSLPAADPLAPYALPRNDQPVADPLASYSPPVTEVTPVHDGSEGLADDLAPTDGPPPTRGW